MKNEGKRFETDFIKSLKPDTWRLRLQDAGGWSNGTNTRFTISNPCDFLALIASTLYLLELKSHKGKSIPFSCLKQLAGLYEHHSQYKNVLPVFILNFRDTNQTYAVNAVDLWGYSQTTERKSVPIEFCQSVGVEIPSTVKITHYKYDIEDSLKKL